MTPLTLDQLRELNIARAAQAAKTCTAADGFMALICGLTQDKKLFVFGFSDPSRETLLKMLADYTEAVKAGQYQYGDGDAPVSSGSQLQACKVCGDRAFVLIEGMCEFCCTGFCNGK